VDVVRVVHEVGWVLSLGMHKKKRPRGNEFWASGLLGKAETDTEFGIIRQEWCVDSEKPLMS
jgi:hypothetical protein